MNVAFFLKPKSEVAYLYDDYTLRQALEKMQRHGYSSIPVINRDGKYVNTVSEGDFLWFMLGKAREADFSIDLKDAEVLHVTDVLRGNRYPSCAIGEPIEDLLSRATSQNFIPIVDDRGIFIGIITRKVIIDYFLNHTRSSE